VVGCCLRTEVFARRIVAMGAAAICLAMISACGQPTASSLPTQAPTRTSDQITLPDASREFVSPSGAFSFVVSTRDGWKSVHAIGEHFTGRSSRRLLWSRELPQQFGPRFVIVSDTGSVLMLDEWINVSSQYAVLLLDRDNRQVTQRSTDAVQAVLGVPMNEIVQSAKYGWWITAPPRLDAAGVAVLVGAGGRVLSIRLSDGQLTSS
jgi:hypothetical protein